MLNIINQIMDECIPEDRANRDFCVKFPEEIRHDNLAGQLWFGAEVYVNDVTSFKSSLDFTTCSKRSKFSSQLDNYCTKISVKATGTK